MNKASITIEVPDGKVAKQVTNPDGSISITFVDKESVRSKSWEEFCNNHPTSKNEWWLTHYTYEWMDQIKNVNCRFPFSLATKEDAEGILALIQLTRLHDEWVDDWKPLYRHDMWIVEYYAQYKEKLAVQKEDRRCLLQFPTEEMAVEFLNCFKDLIEKAKKFI